MPPVVRPASGWDYAPEIQAAGFMVLEAWAGYEPAVGKPGKK